MPNSPRMNWPYPSQDQDPWFDQFVAMVQSQDASAYANREDRQLVLARGGIWEFDASSGLLEWDADLEVLSLVSGPRLVLPAGNVTLTDGQALYVNLTRSPTSNLILSAQVSVQVPSTDEAYVICVRRDAEVYFRHGRVLADGASSSLFSVAGAVPHVLTIVVGEMVSPSETEVVVGAISFSPLDYAPLSNITFRALAKSNTGDDVFVHLRNATDSEVVAQLTFSLTDIAKEEEVLVLGSGTGEIDDPEHIYDVVIYVDSAPEQIYLYSAELRIS